jgi:hypothetical protein
MREKGSAPPRLSGMSILQQPADLPKSFRISRSPDRLVIRQRQAPLWVSFIVLPAIIAFYVWFIALLLRIPAGRHPAVAFLIFLPLSAIPWYIALVGSLNQLEVVVTHDEISKRIWPLPVPAARWKLRREEVARVYASHQRLMVSGSGDVYHLKLQCNSGERLVIAGNFGSPGTAIALGRLIQGNFGPCNVNLDDPIRPRTR